MNNKAIRKLSILGVLLQIPFLSSYELKLTSIFNSFSKYCSEDKNMILECQFYERAGVGKIKIGEEYKKFRWNFQWKGWITEELFLRTKMKKSEDVLESSADSVKNSNEKISVALFILFR